MQTKAIYHIFGKTEGVQFLYKSTFVCWIVFVCSFLRLIFWWFCVWDYHYPLQHKQFFRFRWYTWIEQEQSIKIIDELTRTNKEQGAHVLITFWKDILEKRARVLETHAVQTKKTADGGCSLSVSNLVTHLLLNRLLSQFFFESR